MKSFFTLLMTVFCLASIQAADHQKYLSYFNAQTILQANTATNTSDISLEEKESILWTNLARLEPQNFYKMLIHYVQTNQHLSLSNPYVQSLLLDLKNQAVLTPLYPTPLLNKNASTHALYSQKTKNMGHENFENRARIAFNNNYKSYGENCVYGITDALDAVISLLIDDGVKDLGHRKIILSQQFNLIGVSMKPFYSNRQKVLVQQFGYQPDLKISEPKIETPIIANTSTVSNPSIPTSSSLKRMYINGKYVWVDTSKYYTPSEYQLYLKKAQQQKSR